MALSDYFKNRKTTKLGNSLKPMGEFALIDAHDVIVDYDEETKTETRLDDKLKNIGSSVEVTTDFSANGAGKAADAKAVGDVLGDIHSILKKI